MQSASSKKLFKIAVALYVVSFLAFNWAEVSWIFNYQAWYGIASDFFTPYPSLAAMGSEPYFYANDSRASGEAIPGVSTNYTTQTRALEIPKLNLLVPMVFSQSADPSAVEKDLDNGVAYYPGSVQPGQTGHIVILGHSAPPLWPKIQHDWVFTELDKLAPGDSVLVDINNKQYTYIVKKTLIIKKGEEIPTDGLIANGNMLSLVSCWPPGKDYQRIVVQAELKVN